MSTHTGACHSGKQCTAVPTSHYLPTAKRTWQAMLVFIHPCNLVGEMSQTPERFQRNRLRSCGAEHHSILKSESRIFRFTEFSRVRFFLISVDRHFAKVSAHILYTKLRHPRLYQTEFVFIYEEFYLYRSFAISVIWHLSVPLAFLLPRKPVLIKHVGEWLGHDRIAREALTFAAKVQFLFFHAITGKAISRSMLLLATEATAFYVCRASTAVKAAFAR